MKKRRFDGLLFDRLSYNKAEMETCNEPLISESLLSLRITQRGLKLKCLTILVEVPCARKMPRMYCIEVGITNKPRSPLQGKTSKKRTMNVGRNQRLAQKNGRKVGTSVNSVGDG